MHDNFLYSAGMDAQAIQIDYRTGQMVRVLSTTHQDSVMRVDCSPFHPSLVATVSTDGRINIVQASDKDPHCMAMSKELQLMAIKFHPTNEHLIAVAGDHGVVDFYDLRSPRFALTEHRLQLNEHGGSTDVSVTSIDFDQQGTHMLLSCQSFLPTLISVPDGRVTVFFHPSFRNLSTIKSMVFSPDGSEVFCGSDNRYVFRFQVPPDTDYQTSSWTDSFLGSFYQGLQYADQPAMVVDHPIELIGGHRSNANNVLCHPTLPYVYSCGVEKSILCHSTFTHGVTADCQPPPAADHRLPVVYFSVNGDLVEGVFLSRPVAGGHHDNAEEDPVTLSLFDVLNSQAESRYLQD